MSKFSIPLDAIRAPHFPSASPSRSRLTVSFQALGCRLNEAELETWSNQFQRKGFGIVSQAIEADIVVLNTCAVTAEADRKSRQQIKRLHKMNPAAKLVVSGCHATLNKSDVENYLGVDLVVDNNQKDHLVEQTLTALGLPDGNPIDAEDSALYLRGRHRAFIKVQDGCRYRCTYCVVTLARGEERSREIDDIVAEINRLHGQGVLEVVIAGVHVGGYGSDLNSSLYVLLQEILSRTTVPRIRLASVEPWDLPAQFFQLFSDSRLMSHMHLPLQSGADSVLRRMARRCKTTEFERLVDQARTAVEGFNVTTDLIVGFPGETDSEWQKTMRFVEKVGFGHMHIFRFSPRSGTKAARLPDPVSEAIKKSRSQEMHSLANQQKLEAMNKMVGKSIDVLWENQNEQSGRHMGYTPNYFRISAELNGRDTKISEVLVSGLESRQFMLLGECSE